MKGMKAAMCGVLSAAFGAGCATESTRIARHNYAVRHDAPSQFTFFTAASPVEREAMAANPPLTLSTSAFIAATPPPTPTSQPPERIPSKPAREAIWIEGHWSYTNHLDDPYAWLPGHWE